MTARVNAGGGAGIPGGPGESLAALQAFFRSAPAAHRATRPLRREAEVALELDGTPARFSMASGAPEVLAGPAADPDFALVLPAGAVRRLTSAQASVGELGVSFLEMVISRDPAQRVRVRLRAPTSRLVGRGYLRVLALGGLQVAWWLIRAGVRSPLAAIERLRRG